MNSLQVVMRMPSVLPVLVVLAHLVPAICFYPESKWTMHMPRECRHRRSYRSRGNLWMMVVTVCLPVSPSWMRVHRVSHRDRHVVAAHLRCLAFRNVRSRWTSWTMPSLHSSRELNFSCVILSSVVPSMNIPHLKIAVGREIFAVLHLMAICRQLLMVR